MRMKLHIDSFIGDYYVYPIYDIDISGLSQLSGYHQNYAPTTDKGFTHHSFYVNNNQLIVNHIPSDVPRKPEQTGNIIPTRSAHNYELGGYYYLENWDNPEYFERLYSQPSDFSTSVNYVEPTKVGVYYPVYNTRIYGWSSTKTYADKKKMTARLLYTETGTHFFVSKYYRSPSSGVWRFSVGVGISPGYNYENEPRWNFCTASNVLISTNLRLNREYSDNESFRNGINLQQIFVHYTLDNTEFYGIAHLYFPNFGDATAPTRIDVIALDSTFWGDSIISGGESGAGKWGNSTIPTINDGTFSSTSDNVGTDNPNYSTTAIQTRVNSALSGLFSGLTGVYSIYLLDTADGQSISFTELTRIYNVLYASGNDKFLTRYLQSMYNPLSAVIAMHLLPYQFTASALFGVTVKKQLTISGYNVSNAISETSPPEYNILKPIGRVVFPSLDMPKYFGGFADFAPYTQCILHLPFIGAIELKTNAIAHGSITVEYLCDMISGNVTARISCTDNTGENTQYVHTASGNCAYNLPLFTMNQNGDAVGKLLSGGAGIVSGALTGNPVNVATGIAGVVGSAIESSFSPRSTQISGNMGGNNMLMSNLDIWLEIIRPVWVENMYYQKLNGIPADMSNCIADCGQDANAGIPYDGFLQIEKIDLDNVPCTEQEKQEIETLLKQGVFIRGSEI